jgi:uncharacterized membrane protein
VVPEVVGLPEVAVVEDSAVSAAAAVASAEAEPGRVGSSMRTKEFISRLDHDRIVKAIRDAEANTSGEIRVDIQRGELKEDALAIAQARFHRLGMHKTRDRNAVLIFVAPRVHQFAVVGDEAIHRKSGDTLWQDVVAKMRAHFQNERFSDAIVDAIRDVGEVLAQFFPRKPGDADELPNAPIEE